MTKFQFKLWHVVLVAIALLLQLAVIFLAVYYCRQYFVWVQTALSLIGLLLFLYIINKKETPEFKLPWLFLLVAFPVFGTLVYLLFANTRVPRRIKSKLGVLRMPCKTYLSLSSEETAAVRAQAGDYAGAEQYLSVNAFTEGSAGNRVTFFKIGEDFFEDLLVELRKAEKFILMEYFIVDPGKMWNAIHEILLQKVSEGVEVLFLYDDIGSLGMVENNYWKKLQKEGIRCHKFNALRPVISGVYNNRDHRKITVIDGKVGYTGGVNLGDEYINENHRLGHWKDTAIKIEGKEVRNLTAMFFQMFDFGKTGQCLLRGEPSFDYGKYFPADLPAFDDAGVVHFFGDGPEPLYPEMVGENNYINLMQRAEKYIWITTPYLIPDYNLTTALRNAAFRGIDVRIVTPHIPDKKVIFNMTRSNYKYLMEAGVRIYEYTPGFVHAKQTLIDGEAAFVGTINLDYRSLVHHYECGAVMIGTPCLREIRADFEEIFAVSEEVTPEKAKIGLLSTFVNSVLQIFAPLF